MEPVQTYLAVCTACEGVVERARLQGAATARTADALVRAWTARGDVVLLAHVPPGRVLVLQECACGREHVRARGHRTEWIVADVRVPDDDRLVLVTSPGDDYAGAGYFAGGDWCDANGWPIDVLWWAEIPPPPGA